MAPPCRRRWRGARGSWLLRAMPAMRTRSCSRWSRSMARRAAARCSPPSRARAHRACSPCRPSRSTPTSPRRRSAACCCSATERLTQTWTKLALTAVANNARAIMALDRLLPLIAIAGVDNTRRLSVGELNRWYEVMQQDDPARAPFARLPDARALARDRAPCLRVRRAARGGAGRRAEGLAAGRDPAGAAGRGAGARRAETALLARSRSARRR